MIELIISILTIILFLALLWFAIYLTLGTDLSGRDSGLGTTNVIFIMVLITLLLITGIIWFIL
jgi:hypothetical protein